MSTEIKVKSSNAGNGWKARWSNGVIGEVECASWNGFLDFLNDDSALKEKHHFYFRGHASDDWKLEATLKRNTESNNLTKLEEQTLGAFKKHCLGRRGHNPPQLNENEWWALGQHYGLKTPLLDWSESPYISAFFAFNDADIGDGNVAIWMLSKSINETPCIEKLRKEKQLEFVHPYLDENARLINQRGLFVRSPDMMCIEEWAKDIEKVDNKMLLAKILIPRSEQKSALDSLDKMNINEFTLFPDLSGAGKYSNYVAKRSLSTN